jgi:hypothetical protein
VPVYESESSCYFYIPGGIAVAIFGSAASAYDLLTIPSPRIELFKKSPIYSLPKLWNDLDDLKLQHPKTTFRISLKEKLLNEINP